MEEDFRRESLPKAVKALQNDTFDYTEWQRNLWKDKSIDEIYAMAKANEAPVPFSQRFRVKGRYKQ
jgi:hypothetical protein